MWIYLPGFMGMPWCLCSAALPHHDRWYWEMKKKQHCCGMTNRHYFNDALCDRWEYSAVNIIVHVIFTLKICTYCRKEKNLTSPPWCREDTSVYMTRKMGHCRMRSLSHSVVLLGISWPWSFYKPNNDIYQLIFLNREHNFIIKQAICYNCHIKV